MIILFALISQLIYSLLLLYFYSTGTKRLKNTRPNFHQQGLLGCKHTFTAVENISPNWGQKLQRAVELPGILNQTTLTAQTQNTRETLQTIESHRERPSIGGEGGGAQFVLALTDAPTAKEEPSVMKPKREGFARHSLHPAAAGMKEKCSPKPACPNCPLSVLFAPQAQK